MCSSSLEVVPLYWRTEICSDFGDDLGGRGARWDVDGFAEVLRGRRTGLETSCNVCDGPVTKTCYTCPVSARLLLALFTIIITLVTESLEK